MRVHDQTGGFSPPVFFGRSISEQGFYSSRIFEKNEAIVSQTFLKRTISSGIAADC
jgi:hypothetical protein